MVILILPACSVGEKNHSASHSPFDEDVAFLKKYSAVIELTDTEGKSRIAVMPALQGRVMTSTSGGPENFSYGWINKALFQSGDTSVHMNAFGGEERFWLGPEGGQFSIFFAKGSAFTLEEWHTPALIDLEPYDVVAQNQSAVTVEKNAKLTNYSGTSFDIIIRREIKVLDAVEAFQLLSLEDDPTVHTVAYRTVNTIENTGNVAWSKDTGLLSIWLLGMFNPSPTTTVIIPFHEGAQEKYGAVVNDDYFGKVPAERLKISKGIIYFKGDGQYRSKIGLSPFRAKDVLGSYDMQTKVLTIVQYNKPDNATDYVNSKWEIQDKPYQGDVINSYNDGPPQPGAKPLGPFYELETSSPAKELKPGEKLVHIQSTFHFQGDENALSKVAAKVFGTTLTEVKTALDSQ